MKLKLYPTLRLLSAALLLLCQLQGKTQNVYFRETFLEGTGTNTADANTLTVTDYVSGTGTWKFYGVYLTTGSGCLNDAANNTGSNRHPRSTNVAGLVDTAYMILPDVNYGIASVTVQRSRRDRRLTFWINSNNTTDPAAAGWTLANVCPKSANTPITLCVDTTLQINSATARRLMIKFERGASAPLNNDIDSILLTSVTPIVLPVTYASFGAVRNDNGINLRWSVAAEVNTVSYQVERSLNGTEFQAIGSQRASRSTAYGFLDAAAPAANAYYRIKAIDADGRITLSEVVKVVGGKQTVKSLSVWPNPVDNGQLNVQMKVQGNVTISLYDAQGQQWFTKQTSGNGEAMNLQLSTSQLAKGIYLLRVQSATGSYTERVVVN